MMDPRVEMLELISKADDGKLPHLYVLGRIREMLVEWVKREAMTIDARHLDQGDRRSVRDH